MVDTEPACYMPSYNKNLPSVIPSINKYLDIRLPRGLQIILHIHRVALKLEDLSPPLTCLS